MIHFVTTSDHSYTMKELKGGLTAPFQVHSYEGLFRRQSLPGGLWVFADHERLSAHECEPAARMASQIEAGGNPVWNHPGRVRSRHELLTALLKTGFHDIGVWRASEMPEPDRYPVLLKIEHEHSNRFPDLIHTKADLEARLLDLQRLGMPLRHVLVITFANAEARPGVYHKHSVFRIGDAWIAHPRFVSANWNVKYRPPGIETDEEVDDIIEELQTNRHAEAVRRAFEIAQIAYGRIDFGFVDGRVKVFEINTNPLVPRVKKHRRLDFEAAMERSRQAIFAALSANATTGRPVDVDWSAQRFEPSRYWPWRRLRRP